MNAANKAFDDDRRELITEQLAKLTSSISIANGIADGTGSLTDYSEADRRKLADRFAQATGILMCCAGVSKDQKRPPNVISMYESNSKLFMELSYKSGLISGDFDDHDEMMEHLKKLANYVVEYMYHYKIDPVELHAAAMDVVRGRCDEPEKKHQ